jgi:Rieske Fe-S protein
MVGIERYGSVAMQWLSAVRTALRRARHAPCAKHVPTGADPYSRRRRLLLKAGLGLGLSFRGIRRAVAQDAKSAPPQIGDWFVYPSGDRAGQTIRPGDLPLGGPQQLAYPVDPQSKVVRDGTLFNQVVLIRLDPEQISADARENAADGVVAYSAVCTHQACPVSMWKADAKTLFCSCHASQFDPKDHARVVDGPAPRRLPMLPLKIADGMVAVAGEFSSRVGGQTH